MTRHRNDSTSSEEATTRTSETEPSKLNKNLRTEPKREKSPPPQKRSSKAKEVEVKREQRSSSHTSDSSSSSNSGSDSEDDKNSSKTASKCKKPVNGHSKRDRSRSGSAEPRKSGSPPPKKRAAASPPKSYKKEPDSASKSRDRSRNEDRDRETERRRGDERGGREQDKHRGTNRRDNNDRDRQRQRNSPPRRKRSGSPRRDRDQESNRNSRSERQETRNGRPANQPIKAEARSPSGSPPPKFRRPENRDREKNDDREERRMNERKREADSGRKQDWHRKDRKDGDEILKSNRQDDNAKESNDADIKKEYGLSNNKSRKNAPKRQDTPPLKTDTGEIQWGGQKLADQLAKDAAEKETSANAQQEVEKPNFGLSGALTADTNTFNGVVVKYSEPPESRKPKVRWRFYPFKGDEALPALYMHRQSAYLIGRDHKVADMPVDHPSCSKQHAVLQYRSMKYNREDGVSGRRTRPYIIDLGSANGTYLNGERIDSARYYEVQEQDVLKFGFSSREYVMLHEQSVKDVEAADKEGSDQEVKPEVKTEMV